MNIRQRFITTGVGLALAWSALLSGQGRPEDNVGRRHPNLEAAQRLSTQAYERMRAAQRANEFDLAGHAQKAEELLDQANRQMAAAANTANHDRHGR